MVNDVLFINQWEAYEKNNHIFERKRGGNSFPCYSYGIADFCFNHSLYTSGRVFSALALSAPLDNGIVSSAYVYLSGHGMKSVILSDFTDVSIMV